MKTATASLIILCLTATTAIASPDHHDHDDHFHVAAPTDHCSAITLLNDSAATVRTAKQKNDFDAIHEASYSLRAAIEFLEEEIDQLEETIEEMHEASEKKQKDVTKRHYDDFIKEYEQLMASCV